MAMIECKYSCKKCGIERQAFDVPERGPAEDIKHFMDRLTIVVAGDHSKRSPFCEAREITELLIPAPVNPQGRIGAAELKH